MDAAPTLAAKGLCKTFRGQQVLKGVDFQAAAGELIVIIGRSGCGKSTLLRCLNGLEVFDEGDIRFGDFVLERKAGAPHGSYQEKARALRSNFGMVFQSFNLFPHLDLLGNIVAAPMIVKGLIARSRPRPSRSPAREGRPLRATPAIIRSRCPAASSSAPRSRARSAMSPKVMLYDEPTSRSTRWLVDEVFEVMRKLDKEGMTQIVVTAPDALHARGRAQDRVHGRGPRRRDRAVRRRSSAPRTRAPRST